eukprot:13178219-Alexandrium_andersonii.AAC.1
MTTRFPRLRANRFNGPAEPLPVAAGPLPGPAGACRQSTAANNGQQELGATWRGLRRPTAAN